MATYEELYERLSKVGQEHLLKFWSELSDSEQQELAADIKELQLNELKHYFDRCTASLSEDGIKLDDRLQPIPDSKLVSIARSSEEVLSEYRNEGYRQISKGHVGVILMAGGQGEFCCLLNHHLLLLFFPCVRAWDGVKRKTHNQSISSR